MTMHAAYYQYVQNYAAHNTDTASIEQLLLDDASFAEKLKRLEKLAEQRSEDAPLFSISSPELMQQYLGNTMQLSASSLERYQKCPFQYYCNDILWLYQRQKVQMNAANYGSNGALLSGTAAPKIRQEKLSGTHCGTAATGDTDIFGGVLAGEHGR